MPLKIDFELTGAIDTIIMNLFEFGLINKWIKMNEELSTQSLMAEEKQYESEHANIVLTVDHIIGALLIMAFGYALAIITFLSEQIVHRRVRQGADSKFLLFLHKFFRPNRNPSHLHAR